MRVISPNTALRAAAENVDFALARVATPRGAAPYSSSGPSTTKTRPPSPFATITSANKAASGEEDHVVRLVPLFKRLLPTAPNFMPRHVAAPPRTGASQLWKMQWRFRLHAARAHRLKVHGTIFSRYSRLCAMGCLSRHACKRPARAPAKSDRAARAVLTRKVIAQPLAARVSAGASNPANKNAAAAGRLS